MAQKRSFFKNDVRAESYMALSNNSKVLLWDLKANSDDYGFIDQMTVSKAVTGTTDTEVTELIEQGYLYSFDSGKYLLRWFQKDNNVPYQKTQQTICPKELQYVYLDDEYYYQVSLTPVRPIKGWNKIFKKSTKGKDGNFNEWGKEKDVVVPRDYLFEGKEQELEGDYKITPIGATPAKEVEVKQTPSVKDTASVQPEAKEVAPAPTKQANKVQDELKRLDDEQVNPFLTTEKGQQQREALDQEYKPDQQQDITQDDIENLVAGAQTRSMDTQEPQPHYKDVGLTAEQQRELRDNPPEEDTSLPFDEDEDDTQAELNREAQDTQPIGYSPIDTSDLPFPD